MKTADNRRTTQMCQFINQFGFPIQFIPNSFEALVLKWIDEIRNDGPIHPSDVEIIRANGLLTAILPAAAKSLQPVVQAIRQTITEPTMSRLEKALMRFKKEPMLYRQKVLNMVRDNPHGADKHHLHGAVGGAFNGKMLQEIIDYLLERNLIRTEMHRTRQNRFVAIYKPTDDLTTNLLSSSPSHTPKLPKARRISSKPDFDANPNLIWASTRKVHRPGTPEYKTALVEDELIGKVRIIEGENLVDYGIENYCIYPSGNVRLYLRRKNIQGQYSYMNRRWSHASDIVQLSLLPQYDIGPIKSA